MFLFEADKKQKKVLMLTKLFSGRSKRSYDFVKKKVEKVKFCLKYCIQIVFIMASMIEEKVSPNLENTFVKEKLSTSSSSNNMEEDDTTVKSDAVLDEIAAKVDALNFQKNSEDEDSSQELASTDPEDESATIKRQSEIIKKQAETINTLIQQLRIMFDEYNTACQEKEYYEDLSEALIRYIEIYDGSVEIAGDQEEEQGEEENINNLVSSKEGDQQSTTATTVPETGDDSSKAPNQTSSEKQQQQPTEATVTNNEEGPNTTIMESNETMNTAEKPKITNNELIRLNHILLKELIELRNERDLLRESVFFTPGEGNEDDSDLTDEDDDDDDHSCQDCSSTDIANNKMADNQEEEYENNNEEDDMRTIKDESAEDTE